MTYKKKLIEVALPLEAINIASAREKSIRHGHPSTLHLWWARRPLAAARAVIFAQMVDDPSAHPDIFKTEKAQEKERQRLFRIIEQLVLWENTTNEKVLQQARDEIWQSWRYTCAENADHPRALELFDRKKLPAFHDPFAGGGSLPLEAQRLGLVSYASDLNPVAVLICKAMIEIPPKFAARPAVNPKSRTDERLVAQSWRGSEGLAEDVRYYGQWMRDEAQKRIGHLYPKVKVTIEMARDRPDLQPYVGRALTVIAWLWARTVKSPNPAFSEVAVPLVSTFMLSTKPGNEAYLEPIIHNNSYRFHVRRGRPNDVDSAKTGTKLSQGTFRCIMSNTPIRYEYIDDEANAGRMGERLMAVVAEADGKRLFLPPDAEMEKVGLNAHPTWKPDLPSRGTWASNAQGRRYGFRTFGDYFTPRQLVVLDTFCDLVSEARERIRNDASAGTTSDDPRPLRDDGNGSHAYAEAVSVYLAMAIDRMANTLCTIARWTPDRQQTVTAFARQAIAMSWDYPDVNPFGEAAGDYGISVAGLIKGIPTTTAPPGFAMQADASSQVTSTNKVVSTDPPYYDNVGYADLSDFFYVWLRRSLQASYPDLFATLGVPKEEELVANRYRHNSKDQADVFFLTGMTKAMHRLAEEAHPAFPVTIYYAFRQAEGESADGIASTGWQTFLEAVIRAGFAITGTWPIRTEMGQRMIGSGTNALASSIVLVCRKKDPNAVVASRRDFVDALKAELSPAVRHLQTGNIAPVDLQQAIIGPGMAVYTRYAEVLDAEGKPLRVREALALINQIFDEALALQEGDFDADSRWALVWFEQQGFAEGDYGLAEQLSKSKNTSVAGMVDAGFLKSGRGKVRLLRPSELPADWDPSTDPRLSAWEVVHHLVRALETGSERMAGDLVAKLGPRSENARQLAYRLYTISERKKRAAEALSYNALVQSWPEIIRLAQGGNQNGPTQAEMFAEVSE